MVVHVCTSGNIDSTEREISTVSSCGGPPLAQYRLVLFVVFFCWVHIIWDYTRKGFDISEKNCFPIQQPVHTYSLKQKKTLKDAFNTRFGSYSNQTTTNGDPKKAT